MPKIQYLLLALINLWVIPPIKSHLSNVGDQVPLFANKIGPLNNPSETYEYYDLPFCPPDELIRKKESLGEVLNGDRLITTGHNINFKEITEQKILCTKTLNREEVTKYRDAIQRDFYFEMQYDDLPFWGFIGKNEGQRSYLFTQVQFDFLYNDNHVVEVHAFSDPNHVVDVTEDAEIDVQFTYSATWNESTVKYLNRMSRYSRASLLPPIQQLHYFSLSSSAVIFMISVILLAVLHRWNIKSDLRKYSPGDEDDKEVGLSSIDGEFQMPFISVTFMRCYWIWNPNFSRVRACGLFVLTSLKILEPYSGGTLWTWIVILYTLTSAIAGYTAVSFHSQFSENGWERSVFLTGIIFMGPLLLVMSVLNTVAIFYKATSALPFGTIILLFIIYTFITLPLLALGGFMGHKHNHGTRMASLKRISREIPPVIWNMKTQTQMILGGLLPFSGIFVELHLFCASLWSFKVFTQVSVVFVSFSILVCLTVVLSIGLTYVQLSGEDPRWWWRSVLRGGSTAIFMFGYMIYFYAKSDMSGLMQLSYFLGINICICYAFFLMLGAVSFRASSVFMSHIYHAVKSE